MTQRILTPGTPGSIAEDIRDHRYAILQTHVERIPRLVKGLTCREPDGCTKPATLVTLAVHAVTAEGNRCGIYLVKDDGGNPLCIVVCEEHRCEASHDLYFRLTNRQRPDGIRAHDALGKHIEWA